MKRFTLLLIAAGVAVAAVVVTVRVTASAPGDETQEPQSLTCVVASEPTVGTDVVSTETVTLPQGFPIDVIARGSDDTFMMTPAGNIVEGVSLDDLHCEPHADWNGEEKRVVELCAGALWGTAPATFAVRSLPAGATVHIATTSRTTYVTLVPEGASLEAALRGDFDLTLVTTPRALARSTRTIGACKH